MKRIILVLFISIFSALFPLAADEASSKGLSSFLSLAFFRMIDFSIYADIESLKYLIILVLLSYFLTNFFWRNSIVKLMKGLMTEKVDEDSAVEPTRNAIPILREIKSNVIKPERNNQSIIRKLLQEKMIGNWIIWILIFLTTVYLVQIFMLLLNLDSYFTLPCLFILFFFVNGIFQKYLAKPFNHIVFNRLEKKIQDLPKGRVLILRVFGDPGSTSFLFDWFAEKWRLFGPSITITDPVLIQQEFRINNLLRPESHLFLTYFITNIIAIIGFFILPFYFGEPGKINFLFPLTLALYVLVPLIYWITTLILGFWASKEFIQKLGSSDFFGNKNSRLEFPIHTLFCFDTRWKKAVEVAAKNVDLVLMDVRDYSLERAGSSWELGFLAHFFPLSQVLFLVDSEEKKTMIETVFKKEIAFANPGSPNDKNVTINFLIPDKSFRGIKASIDTVEALWGLMANK